MNNMSILRAVALGLIIALIILLLGCFALLWKGQTVPNEFWAIAFSIVTGLLGLLAPSRQAAAGD